MHTLFPTYYFKIKPIYKQLRKIKAHGIIAYNRRRDSELGGFDEQLAPTCVRERSYR